MKIQKINMVAGEPHTIGRGKFVRLFQAQEMIAIETQAINEKGNQNGHLLANTGAEFNLFDSAVITSPVDQEIILAFSELPIYDNRLGVNGNAVIETNERASTSFDIREITVTVGGTTEILADGVNRKEALITSDAPIWIRSDAYSPAFPVDGVLTHTAAGRLEALPQGASNCTVWVLEYLN